MNQECIEISTEVFRLLKEAAPVYVGAADEKPGPTQRILLTTTSYNNLIDLAIDHHKTLDCAIIELCGARARARARTRSQS